MCSLFNCSPVYEVFVGKSLTMEAKRKHTMNGWIRENYKGSVSFPSDILNMIWNFYRLIFYSQILTSEEEVDFGNFLFKQLKQQPENANIKFLDVILVFRASEHQFNAHQFHKHVDYRGPTVTIISTDKGDIFGGYSKETWPAEVEPRSKHKRIDPRAFLFTIRPKISYIPLKASGDKVGICRDYGDHGPIFGSGPDIHISNPGWAARSKKDSVNSQSFAFDTKQIIPNSSDRYFQAIEYEVYDIWIV